MKNSLDRAPQEILLMVNHFLLLEGERVVVIIKHTTCNLVANMRFNSPYWSTNLTWRTGCSTAGRAADSTTMHTICFFAKLRVDRIYGRTANWFRSCITNRMPKVVASFLFCPLFGGRCFYEIGMCTYVCMYIHK